MATQVSLRPQLNARYRNELFQPGWSRQFARPVRQEAIDELDPELALPDGDQRPQLAALRLALSLPSLPSGDVDLQPAPTERSPQQGLDEPHGLHAARPDHLRRQRDQPAADVQAVGAFRDGQPVLLVEAAPDEGRHAERPDEAAAGEKAADRVR